MASSARRAERRGPRSSSRKALGNMRRQRQRFVISPTPTGLFDSRRTIRFGVSRTECRVCVPAWCSLCERCRCTNHHSFRQRSPFARCAHADPHIQFRRRCTPPPSLDTDHRPSPRKATGCVGSRSATVCGPTTAQTSSRDLPVRRSARDSRCHSGDVSAGASGGCPSADHEESRVWPHRVGCTTGDGRWAPPVAR